VARITPVLILCRRLFVGAIFAYVFASLTLGGSRAARPVFYSLTVGWFALLCWTRTWRIVLSESSTANICHGLELVGFNLALTLAAAEFSLRACSLLCGTPFLSGQPLDAYRLVPGRDYGGGLCGNSLGYPGAEFRRAKRPGFYRIAALGDSFAVGPAVPFADNYLSLLQAAQADIEVYNFGVSGAGPREYHAILRAHALGFQPDLVLVSLFIGNDITESLAMPRHLDPRRHCTYRLLDRGLRLVTDRWRRCEEEQGSNCDRFTAGVLAPETFREVEARRLAVCLNPAPPSLEKKWQRALGYLERIITDCQQRDVPVACVLIPDEFQVNPEVFADAIRATQIEVSALDLERPQQRLLSFFAEHRVSCLDLLPAFKAVPNTYRPRDTHWNERGNWLAAEQIRQWLKSGFVSLR
jgi:hypothetical protein